MQCSDGGNCGEGGVCDDCPLKYPHLKGGSEPCITFGNDPVHHATLLDVIYKNNRIELDSLSVKLKDIDKLIEALEIAKKLLKDK